MLSVFRCRRCHHPAINHAGGFGCLFPGCGCGSVERRPPVARAAESAGEEWSLFIAPLDLEIPEPPRDLRLVHPIRLELRRRPSR
jgi:hypothetical protein